jgi:hypothetical protein
MVHNIRRYLVVRHATPHERWGGQTQLSSLSDSPRHVDQYVSERYPTPDLTQLFGTMRVYAHSNHRNASHCREFLVVEKPRKIGSDLETAPQKDLAEIP